MALCSPETLSPHLPRSEVDRRLPAQDEEREAQVWEARSTWGPPSFHPPAEAVEAPALLSATSPDLKLVFPATQAPVRSHCRPQVATNPAWEALAVAPASDTATVPAAA